MSHARPSTVRLRYRGADVFLALGQYLVGRSASCQIVLDHPRVSRRHARLTLDGDRVAVTDLGSVNGIYVNGERVSGSRDLQNGDQLLIGGEQLEITIESTPTPSRVAETQGGLGSIPPAPPSTSWDAVTGGVGTQKADVFDLVGKIADRSLAEGKSEEAESLLRAHLGKVLEQAKRSGQVADTTRGAALHYALELARALEQPRWLDYTVDLLCYCKVLVPEALARDIQSSLAKIPGADLDKLDGYLKFLEGLPPSLERAQAITRVQGLRRVAASKQ
ncbi:MAG: FHA domain-containing protein [Polyangiaceae bacterium]